MVFGTRSKKVKIQGSWKQKCELKRNLIYGYATNGFFGADY